MSGKVVSPTEVAATGYAVGLGSGFIVTKRAKRVRPSQTKGKLGNHVKLIRGVIREVAGWSPYEKRIQEILKGGGNNPNKRAWRFAKLRLGTHQRAKRKVAEMTAVNALLAQKAQQASKQKATTKSKSTKPKSDKKTEKKAPKPKAPKAEAKAAEKKEEPKAETKAEKPAKEAKKEPKGKEAPAAKEKEAKKEAPPAAAAKGKETKGKEPKEAKPPKDKKK